MATIRLGRYEARQGNLPPVCIRCGTAAGVYRKKVFYFSPWWIYLGIPLAFLPFFILALFMSKPALVRVPLCPLHRNLWRWQQPVLLLVCSLVSVIFGLIPFQLLLQGRFDAEKEGRVLIVASLATVAGPYLYLGAAIALKYLGIHATEVNTNSLTLTGVAAEFAEALRVQPQNMGALAPVATRSQP
jgi:hypothetical protein